MIPPLAATAPPQPTTAPSASRADRFAGTLTKALTAGTHGGHHAPQPGDATETESSLFVPDPLVAADATTAEEDGSVLPDDGSVPDATDLAVALAGAAAAAAEPATAGIALLAAPIAATPRTVGTTPIGANLPAAAGPTATLAEPAAGTDVALPDPGTATAPLNPLSTAPTTAESSVGASATDAVTTRPSTATPSTDARSNVQVAEDPTNARSSTTIGDTVATPASDLTGDTEIGADIDIDTATVAADVHDARGTSAHGPTALGAPSTAAPAHAVSSASLRPEGTPTPTHGTAVPTPGPTGSAALAASDAVRFMRELGPARAVQRLAIDLDGAMVAVRLDHGGAATAVHVRVVDDPAGRLDASWTTSVERTLTRSMQQDSHAGGQPGNNHRGHDATPVEDSPPGSLNRRWVAALTEGASTR